MQVVNVDMNQDKTCPGSWHAITSPRKLCLGGITAGCDPAHFTTHKAAFDHIYRQTKSYQKGASDSFTFMQSIN